MRVTPTPALVRLERKLARDRRAILSAADVHLLDIELRRALVASFSDFPAEALERSEDTIRWHALGQRCQEARGVRGIREVSVGSGIPQYRLRAVESGRLSEIRADLARSTPRGFQTSRHVRPPELLSGEPGPIEQLAAPVGRADECRSGVVGAKGFWPASRVREGLAPRETRVRAFRLSSDPFEASDPVHTKDRLAKPAFVVRLPFVLGRPEAAQAFRPPRQKRCLSLGGPPSVSFCTTVMRSSTRRSVAPSRQAARDSSGRRSAMCLVF